MNNTRIPALIAICLALVVPSLVVQTSAATGGTHISDGKTATLTPEGTFIVPPPGAPADIIKEDQANVTSAPGAFSWGPMDLTRISPLDLAPGVATPASSTTSCTNYRAGWYETTSSSLYGGHIGIRPANMPPNPLWYCVGKSMGYTDGVSFDASSWIQTGLATFPGETGAKWFCQSNDAGNTNTKYGTASAYANGATVYTWFARDSSGVWRTYRYDTGPYSIELPCTITRGASGNLQTFGEIQGATSTSAPMGPWTMLDERYMGTDGAWYRPSQLQAYYPGGTPCPPYGAGTVSAGSFSPGTGAACTTGTSPYPN